ncbi:ABC transporter permease [Microvirga sp. WGZ8]|uniref:ABC transporter permease n=1 Tax=Microvirga puerhi TaxID=2876078 RepID=A0ABS7VTS7_9HYPH|nr:ABC transporter permease [Microvirga puerhi]MBZ6078978.1 ABC transporter permease [Microvirga puerhi]
MSGNPRPAPVAVEEASRPASSRIRQILKQMRKSKFALPGGAIVLIFIILAILAPWIAPHDPYANDLMAMLLPPSAEHPFGTDELGRDILSRVLVGARLSLVEGLFSVSLAMLIGVPTGMISGYVGGRTDTVIMRIIDVMLAFPGVLLAIVIVSILGPSLVNAMIAVAIYTVPIFARLARGSTLSVKEEPYIEACQSAGMRHSRILLRHIFPNIASTLWVMAALRVALAILTASSLSFLGLGAQAPSPEWGAMLAAGRNYMLVAPHVVIFPGGAIVLLVLGINLFQDGLRLALDPKMAER